jgi:hypothetical protein
VRHAWILLPLLLAGLAVAAWLPFLHRPLSSDESGFLLLSRQWSPGRSLYGSYWVDRPPLLLWLFGLAGHLSPAVVSPVGLTSAGVKVLGAVASGASVLLAGVLGRTLEPRVRHVPAVCSLVAAALLANPMLGMPETDGEVLAAPFVLLGLVCFLGGVRRPWGREAFLATAVAGASATCAALVKQNIVDVFVLVGVLSVLTVLGSRRGRRTMPRTMPRIVPRLGALGVGAVGALAVALTGAALRGTSPAALWDAVVVFRFQASAVIGSSSTGTTTERMTRLWTAFLVSGAAAALLVCAALALLSLRRRATGSLGNAGSVGDAGWSTPGGRAALVWAALAMSAWEIFGAAMGGSYWLHYLTGLVPGLVMLVGLARPTRPGAVLLAAVVAYAMCCSGVTWARHVSRPSSVSADDQVVAYLRSHPGGPGGVVVAFGHPGIVAASGLSSPYEHLWSLPVRVRDPRLTELRQVMAGPSAPQWMVVSGSSLGSWGLDARAADAYLAQHYQDEHSFGDWHIWERRPSVTTAAEVPS